MRRTVIRALAAASLGLVVCLAPPAMAESDTSLPARSTAPASALMFSGDYRDSSARDVILDIAKAAKMSAVIPADLEGNITAHLDKIPVMRALALVAGLANADYRVMDDTIYILKRDLVVRPATNGVSPGGSDMTESEVQRIVRQIDAEAAAPPPAPRAWPVYRSQPVRIETYVNIQTSAPSMPAFPPVPYGWPVYGGVVYAPLGGVNQVGWNPSGLTRIPGGHIIPAWRTHWR